MYTVSSEIGQLYSTTGHDDKQEGYEHRGVAGQDRFPVFAGLVRNLCVACRLNVTRSDRSNVRIR